jgi:hypothetical protein
MPSLYRLGELDDGLPAGQLGWTPLCLDNHQRRRWHDFQRNSRAMRHFHDMAHVLCTSTCCRVPALMIILLQPFQVQDHQRFQ